MNSTTSNARFNVGLLAACQAMLMTNNATLIAVNGLAGLALAPTPSLATLPVTCWVVGGGIATMQASKYMKKVGRRAGLIRGASVGILGALICAAAIWQASFWLLCFGALVWGIYNAFGQYYRFVAAEVAAPDFRATAVSLVLAGGLVGGIIGPTLSRYTVDLVGPKFAGAYLALTVVALITMAILSRIRIPDPTAAEQAASGRPLSEIAAQPKYIVAVMSGALSYGVMNFLMTSTPIAMGVCGHPYGDAAFVISSHVIGMFAPSFVTGGLIRRFGTIPVMLAGAALNIVSVAIALSGVAVANFWWSLVLLGVGWNFLFTGSTSLSLQAYRPEEKDRAQGAINFCVFAVMALTSFASGALVTTQGWTWLNLGSIVPVGLTGLVLLWFALRLRATRNAPA